MKPPKYLFILSFLLFSFVTHPIFAQASDVQVLTTINKNSIGMDENVRLNIKIVGKINNIDRPRLPEFEGFTSYYSGRSSSFVFTNGVSQSTTEFGFTLVPKAPGRYTLKPIEISVDGLLYRSNPIPVEVTGTLPSSSSSSQMPSLPGTFQTTAPQQLGTPAPPIAAFDSGNYIPKGANPDIFVKTYVDKTDVFPNEQVVLTYSLFTRMPAEIGYFVELPKVTGFWVEDIPPDKNVTPRRVSIAGRTYTRADIKKVVLFGTTPGPQTIEPGPVQADVKMEIPRERGMMNDFFDDDFFGGSMFARHEKMTLTGQPATVNVRAFPTQDQPEHFSGAVGRFTMTASIDQNEVKQNEPVTLTLTIQGEGNIDTVERPWIPDLDSFRVYDSDVSAQINRNMLPLGGQKVFKILFIPNNAGKQQIPSLNFSYFDSIGRRYTTISTPAFPINVKPGDAPPPNLPQRVKGHEKQEIQAEQKDIRFIHDRLKSPMRMRILKVTSRVAAGLDFLLFIVLLALIFQRRQQFELSRNVTLRRTRIANKELDRSLKQLEKLSQSEAPEQQKKFVELAHKAYNFYVSNKLNLATPQSIMVPEVIEGLINQGATQELINKVQIFYEICHQVEYAYSSCDIAQRRELMAVIKSTAHLLERKTKKIDPKVGLFLIGALMLWGSFAYAATNDTSFQEANQLYKAGQFDKAILLYQKSSLFKEGVSSELYYNLGNSYFKNGKVGKSIVNYERALDLDPWNRDIRYNLNYAKASLNYKIEDKTNWYITQVVQLLRTINKDQFILITSLIGFLFLVFAFLGLQQPDKSWMRSSARFWFFLTVLLMVVTALKLSVFSTKHDAIITAPTAAAYFGPADSEAVAFRLTEGLKVKVLRSSGNWCEILLPNKQSGWIEKSNLEKIWPVSS